MLSPRLANSGILIVDDIPFNAELLREILLAAGYSNLAIAANGEEALAMLDAFRPDLILLDLLMPVMDGYAFCRALRLLPDFVSVPVIVQTAITDDSRFDAFAAGATDLINKPIHPGELAARVKLKLERTYLMADLRAYRERTQSELEEARRLQLTLLPTASFIQTLEQQQHLAITSFFQPAKQIGGDFWSLWQSKEQTIWMALCDVSGHGIASALNTFRLSAMLQHVISEAEHAGQLLERMNHSAYQVLAREHYLTMRVAEVSMAQSTLSLASAACPPAVMIRKDGSAEIISGKGFPIGAIASASFGVTTYPFSTGDSLLIFSDALLESPQADGSFTTEEAIAQQAQTLLANMADYASAKYRHSKLLQSLLRPIGMFDGAVPEDDLTIVMITRCA